MQRISGMARLSDGSDDYSDSPLTESSPAQHSSDAESPPKKANPRSEKLRGIKNMLGLRKKNSPDEGTSSPKSMHTPSPPTSLPDVTMYAYQPVDVPTKSVSPRFFQTAERIPSQTELLATHEIYQISQVATPPKPSSTGRHSSPSLALLEDQRRQGSTGPSTPSTRKEPVPFRLSSPLTQRHAMQSRSSSQLQIGVDQNPLLKTELLSARDRINSLEDTVKKHFSSRRCTILRKLR